MKSKSLFKTLPFLIACSLNAEELKTLEIEYPPPMLTGTAVPIKLTNVDPIDTEPPTILVPEGVSNVAAGKEVTASDDFPLIGELSFITDGDKESEDGYYIELFEGTQWVQIDLEKEHELFAIVIWHFHTQQRAYHDVVVQVSNDPEFKAGVVTLFNNDQDNSSKLGQGSDNPYIETHKGKVIPAKSEKARYVRLYSSGNTSNDMNHYCEVEVFGRAQ